MLPDSSAESMITVDQGAIVERGEHDAVDSLRTEALDNLDLLLTIVLAQWPFPDNFDVASLS
jgi:hypothetical protein